MTDRSRRHALATGATGLAALLAGCFGSVGEEDTRDAETEADGTTDGPGCGAVESPSASGASDTAWSSLRAGGSRAGTTHALSGPDLSRTDELHATELLKIGPGLYPPAVRADTIYLSGREAASYAVDLEEGTRPWTVETGDGTSGTSPMVAGQTVFVPTTDGLWAVDANSGADHWRFTVDNTIVTPPGLTETAVVVGTRDGRFYGVDPACGKADWEFDTETGGPTTLATDGTTAFGEAAGTVYAIDPADGTTDWTAEVWSDGAADYQPVVAGDTLLVVRSGRVAARDVTDGNERWTVEVTDRVETALAATTDRCFVIDAAGRLQAIDTSSGEHHWTFDPGRPIALAPTRTTDAVLVVTQESLHAVDFRTGEERASAALGNLRGEPEPGTDLIVRKDAIVLLTDDVSGGRLYRLE